MSKATLKKSLENLASFKTGDGQGYPITSKSLKENEKWYGKIEEDMPFFSEATLYTLMGKEDARTLLAKLRSVCEEAGLDRFKLF